MKLTSLGDLGGAGVLIVESGDEENWFAAGVDLIVDRSMREQGALTCCQGVFDEASTVLFDKAGFHLSAHKVQDLGCPGVGMRSVHAAWSIPLG